MVTDTKFLLIYAALLIRQIPSSFAAPNAHTKGIQTITTSTTVTSGEDVGQATDSTSTNTNIPTIVSVVTSISTASAPVVIQISPDAPSPAPPQRTVTKVEETVIKPTKTPVNFNETFSTWYQWDHNGRKEKMGDSDGGNKKIAVPSGWTPPAGYPTSMINWGRIGKREERDVENADISTSFRTLTALPGVVTATAANNPAPPPPPPKGQQLLPGQIPTTRSDLNGIAVGQGDWVPSDINELHIFSWDADHPEYLAIGGKYANLVSTLVKYAPPPPPPPAPATPTPQSQQQQQQQQQGPITITLPGKTTEQVVMTFATIITKEYLSRVVLSGSESEKGSASASVQPAPAPAPAPAPSVSFSTSLVTIPAGQLGGINKEPTVLSVLVPVEPSKGTSPVAPPSAAAAAPPAPAPTLTAAVVKTGGGESMVTSLVTIPAGQLGGLNQEATVLSVLVPVEKSPAAAAAAPAVVPASTAASVSASAAAPAAPPASASATPQVISTSFRTLSLVANTPAAAAAAVNTPAAAVNTPAAAVTDSASASVSNGQQAQQQAQASPKAQEEKKEEETKGGNTWGTVVPGQEVVVGGKTMEVMTIMSGGP